MLVFATEAIMWLYNKRKFIGYSIIIALTIIFIIFEVYYFKNVNDKELYDTLIEEFKDIVADKVVNGDFDDVEFDSENYEGEEEAN